MHGKFIHGIVCLGGDVCVCIRILRRIDLVECLLLIGSIDVGELFSTCQHYGVPRLVGWR